MGISSSHTSSQLLPSADLKWKVGNKNEAIPSCVGHNILTYEKLALGIDFKDFIYSNLDSDYLMSSLLQNAYDESILNHGISYLQNSDPEFYRNLLFKTKSLEDLILAGINV